MLSKKINSNYCLYNEYLKKTSIAKFIPENFCKIDNKYYFDKEKNFAYWDPDINSEYLYNAWKLYLENKSFPNDKKVKIEITQENNQKILVVKNENDNHIITELTTDYIGPRKSDYEKKFGIYKLASMLKCTRTFAGSMVWPCRKKGRMTINQYKGCCKREHMPPILFALKQYYENDKRDENSILESCFINNEEWFDLFKDNKTGAYDNFINYFCLQNFDKLSAIHQEYLEKIEAAIIQRKENTKNALPNLII